MEMSFRKWVEQMQPAQTGQQQSQQQNPAVKQASMQIATQLKNAAKKGNKNLGQEAANKVAELVGQGKVKPADISALLPQDMQQVNQT